MRRLTAAIALVLVLAVPAYAFAATDGTTMTEASVLDQRAALDGRQVTFEGEAIGELLHADDGGVWLCVLQGGTALSVYLPAEMAEQVDVFGDYEHTGDTVRVTGEFHRACAQHGGDLDVHATSLRIVGPGAERTHPIETWKATLAASGFALTGVGVLIARRKQRAIVGD